MSDVFISYAREDREKAQLLARAFEEQKWTIWWDKVIPPGRKYADVIGEELASAKAVIVLWSQASVASDWVKDEAQEGSNRRCLVPVLVEKVSPPYGFRQVQTADLSEWDGSSSYAELQSLVRGIGSLINKPVSAPDLTNDRADAGKRRLVLFLLAGVALILLLGYVTYRFVSTRPDPNQNHAGGGDANNQNKSTATSCDSVSRQRAAELTGKGILMIDPGGNYNAAALQFKEAILACPDYTDAYFWRGQSYVALQQNKNAVADFKKVVDITTDEDTRQQAQTFIAELEAPHTTLPPANNNTSTNQNAGGSTANGNTGGSTINANTGGSTANANTGGSGANANTGGSTANANTGGSTTNANTDGSNTNKGTRPVVEAQVKDVFGADKSKGITATSHLMLQAKRDPKFVGSVIESALEHQENKGGILKALLLLETVDPEILKRHRKGIEKLLAVAQDDGEQTAVHVKKVERLLNQ
jgi:tetratricopeptide (TPR) repeat protein